MTTPKLPSSLPEFAWAAAFHFGLPVVLTGIATWALWGRNVEDRNFIRNEMKDTIEENTKAFNSLEMTLKEMRRPGS